MHEAKLRAQRGNGVDAAAHLRARHRAARHVRIKLAFRVHDALAERARLALQEANEPRGGEALVGREREFFLQFEYVCGAGIAVDLRGRRHAHALAGEQRVDFLLRDGARCRARALRPRRTRATGKRDREQRQPKLTSQDPRTHGCSPVPLATRRLFLLCAAILTDPAEISHYRPRGPSRVFLPRPAAACKSRASRYTLPDISSGKTKKFE